MHSAQTLNQGFAAEVRAELARQGRTPTWLAEQTEINVNTLHRRLKGGSRFNLTETGQVARALGVPASELIKRAERPAEMGVAS